MNRRLPIAVGLSCLLVAPALLAQTTNALPVTTDLPDMGLSAIRAVGALALVLALFFGGVWVFRNSQPLTWRKTANPKLAILETRPLGNRFGLHVVGYEHQRLLIGSSPTGLTLLTTLPTADEAAVPAGVAADRLPFAQQLQQLLKRGPVPAPAPASSPTPADKPKGASA